MSEEYDPDWTKEQRELYDKHCKPVIQSGHTHDELMKLYDGWSANYDEVLEPLTFVILSSISTKELNKGTSTGDPGIPKLNLDIIPMFYCGIAHQPKVVQSTPGELQ